uniref:Uncharacterized protein n=2 Tax=Enterobacteriaceae TaxID=543 RepID=A0A343YP18_KLEPN|nr:hypothetical protein CLEHKFCG_00058 [Klebsiella pneumoniae subsp. pneumoniae]
MSRNPPQRRKARARNGVAPYSPAAFAGVQGAQATARQRRRILIRMLQALVLRHGMEARRAETVYRLRSRQPARTPAMKTGTGRKQKTGG